MIARRTVPVVAGFVLVALGVTGLATPAHAADATIACTNPGNTDSTLSGNGPWTFELGSCGGYPYVSVASTPLEIRGPADAPQVTVYTGTDYTNDKTGEANPPSTYTGSNPYGSVTLGVRVTYTPITGPTSGTITVEFRDDTNYNLKQTFIITLGSGGGGDSGGGDSGGGDSGSSGSSAGSGSSSTAPTVLLQVLDLFGDDALPADENELVGWEKAVPVNTWQALPQSQDVVGIGANEGKVFLGMATTPDFPADIAQRQVENGWGAYEMHGDDGKVESVFIPAGGSMFVWTQPRLYAVWGTA